MLQRTRECRHLFEILILFLLDKFPEVGLLDKMVQLLWKTVRMEVSRKIENTDYILLPEFSLVKLKSGLVLPGPHIHFPLAFCCGSCALETSGSRSQLKCVSG